MRMDFCRICNNSFEDNDGRDKIQVKQERGAHSIKECARLQGLDWANSVKKGDWFHTDCRKVFVNRPKITSPVNNFRNQ